MSAVTKRQNPNEFLKTIVGKPVVVKLTNGTDYRGILSCLDGFMNIALEQTEEYQNGQLKNKYGDAFIRGNNGKLFLNVEFDDFDIYILVYYISTVRR
jgi:U6 snRNA-associated Sm-like protein LSm6